MVIHHTRDFAAELERLPQDMRRVFKKQEAIFKRNWLDPRLHIKRIREIPGAHAFRVTRRYRVFFYFAGEAAVFFSIGHRKDVYR